MTLKNFLHLLVFSLNELINLKFGASALYSNFTSLLLEGYSAMETAPGISFLFNILKLAVLMLFFYKSMKFSKLTTLHY
jgi:hypothetical protein